MAERSKQQHISENSENNTEEEHDTEESLANDLVVTKYAMAADIVNAVLKVCNILWIHYWWKNFFNGLSFHLCNFFIIS